MKLTTVEQSQSHFTQYYNFKFIPISYVLFNATPPNWQKSPHVPFSIHFLYVFVPDVDQLFITLGNILFLSMCDWPTEKLLFNAAKLTKQQR